MDLLIYANQIFIALIVKKISTTRISVALKVPPHSSFDTFRYVQLLKLKKIMSPLEFQAHVAVLETLGWTRSGPPWTRTGPTPKYFFEISANIFLPKILF